jgi:hypothetical protein
MTAKAHRLAHLPVSTIGAVDRNALASALFPGRELCARDAGPSRYFVQLEIGPSEAGVMSTLGQKRTHAPQ